MDEQNIMIGDDFYYGVEINIDNSTPYRSLVTTSIMNGENITRQGEWNPIEFTVTVPMYFEDPSDVNAVLNKYHGTYQEVLCPYVYDEIINAYITINKSYNAPNTAILEFSIVQVGNEKDYLPVSNLYGYIEDGEI